MYNGQHRAELKCMENECKEDASKRWKNPSQNMNNATIDPEHASPNHVDQSFFAIQRRVDALGHEKMLQSV